MKCNMYLRSGGMPEMRKCIWELEAYLGTKGIPGNQGCTWEPGVYLGSRSVPETRTIASTFRYTQNMKRNMYLRPGGILGTQKVASTF